MITMGTTTTRSPEAIALQREEGLAKANLIRTQRRQLRQQIARLTPLEGAALAGRVLLEPPEFALSMTVSRLLTAVNGIGPARAKTIAGAHKTSPLVGLSHSERALIAGECERRAATLNGWQRRSRRSPDRPQAMRALAGADRVRLSRAGALRAITQTPGAGLAAWRAATLINDSKRPRELDGLTVKAVLEAIPRVGDHGARALIGELALSDSTQLFMLSRSRAARIAAALITRHGRLGRPTPGAQSSAATSPLPLRQAA
jgi:hypothetical protein